MSDKNRIANEEQIKQRAIDGLLEIAGLYTKLRRKGKSYVGSCPIHNENTPSFAVTPHKELAKCFGSCGWKGRNAIDLIMKMENKTYREALEWVADYYHITVEYTDSSTAARVPIPRRVPKPPEPPKPPSTTATEFMELTKKHYNDNTFINYLVNLFNTNIVTDILGRFHIGSAKMYGGAVIFWQVDEDNNVRGGKVLMYNPETGRRFKDKFNWVHTANKWEDYNLTQCFFGEHQLNLPENINKPVGIVESEKTACIASVYLPEYVWLATGGKGTNGDTIIKKAMALADRDVVLFPDIEAYKEWMLVAEEIKDIVNSIQVSDILEQVASDEERAAKLDLADYLVKTNYQEILKTRFIAQCDIIESAPFYNQEAHLKLLRDYLRSLGSMGVFEIDAAVEKFKNEGTLTNIAA